VSKPSVLTNFLQALLAIILGNVVYFVLIPSLPPAARHHPMHLDLGMVLDFWFCLVAYGLIRTARRWRSAFGWRCAFSAAIKSPSIR
jgi:hypothetical protein